MTTWRALALCASMVHHPSPSVEVGVHLGRWMAASPHARLEAGSDGDDLHNRDKARWSSLRPLLVPKVAEEGHQHGGGAGALWDTLAMSGQGDVTGTTSLDQ